jgi:valyl-tRNA synthetase
MPAYGADTLRAWVASVEYQRDVSIGPTTIAQASETLRKLRSATRFIAGNIEDATIQDIDKADLGLVCGTACALTPGQPIYPQRARPARSTGHRQL